MATLIHIEDTDFILRSMKQAAESMGHTLHQADCNKEAARLLVGFEVNKKRLDGVILDLEFPSLPGGKASHTFGVLTFKHIQQYLPETPVILHTGHSFGQVKEWFKGHNAQISPDQYVGKDAMANVQLIEKLLAMKSTPIDD